MSQISELKVLRESEDRVEFKEARKNYPFAGGKHSDPAERRRCVLGYVVALANEGGGRLVLGMADKLPHEVVGTNFAEGEIGDLEDEIYKRLLIRVKTEELYEAKKRVLVINIPPRPIGKLLKFEGVALMRTGESLRDMSDQEIFKILSEQEPDFSAKICVGLTIEELDKQAIQILKQKYAEKQNNKSFLTLPDDQVLSDLELLQDGKLNYAALIMLGKKASIKKYLPQCNIVIEYRLNHSMIPYTARAEYQEPLFIGIDKVWSYINQPASNPLLHISEGPYIYDVPSFNEEVIREAVLNAVAHRSYQIQSDIVIKQYPDEITISNAGGFPIGVDVNNILTVNSIPRSKRLTEILQKTGLVERSGQGVDKMFYHCIMESKPLPDYSKTDAYQVNLTFKAEIQDKAFLFFIREVQSSRDDKLNVLDLLTLDKIRRGICFGLEATVIDKLKKEKLIVLQDKDDTSYLLADRYNQFAAPKVSIKGVTPQQLKVLNDCFDKNDSISRSTLTEAFIGKLTVKQVRNLVSRLEQSKVIKRIGVGRATKYIKDLDQFEKYL